jgi:hypothetical protein
MAWRRTEPALAQKLDLGWNRAQDLGSMKLIILFVLAILQMVSQGSELEADPTKFRDFQILMRDKLSGVEMLVQYGRFVSHGKGEGELWIDAQEEKEPAVTLTKAEVAQLHAEMVAFVKEFHIVDDPDQAAFEERADQGHQFLFEITLRASEQTVKYQFTPDLLKNYPRIRACVLSLVEKFPAKWKNRIDWLKEPK